MKGLYKDTPNTIREGDSMRYTAFFSAVILLVLLNSGCLGQSTPADASMTTSTAKPSTAATTQTTQAPPSTTYPPTTVSQATSTTSAAADAPTPAGEYSPVINSADYVADVTNPFFPLKPGTKYTFDGTDEGDAEHIEVTVTNETRIILGVRATQVRDIVYVKGKLEEATLDWYAQDRQGNVWYFGEDSKEYDKGKVVSTKGSWKAGVDGAEPGIIMEANPAIGDTYRQEYLRGEAEDMAKIVDTNGSATTEYGQHSGLVVTEEWTPLEPGVTARKYYARDIGVVLEEYVKGAQGRTELTSITIE